MSLLFDSFWRAAAYCLHVRVILMSLLPLVLMVVVSTSLAYFYWEPALDAVRATLEGWSLLDAFFAWLASVGLANFKAFMAPLIVVALAMPVVVVACLLVVAMMMTPSMLRLVAQRRFPALEQRRGGSFAGSLWVTVGSTVVALVALIASIPLWFVPPLVLIVPPLIWGWLTYRVMAYDVLAEHASREERRELIRRHRLVLLGMGVLTGYLGAAPSLLWVSGALFLAFAPLLVPLAIWIYTLVFAFSALWFAHYSLAALTRLRLEREPVAPAAAEENVLVEPAPEAPVPPSVLPPL